LDILLESSKIRKRIIALADKISCDYTNDLKATNLLFVCVLKGSIHFASDLLRFMWIDVRIEFIKASSYEGMNQSSAVKIMTLFEKEAIEGKDIIIIEDIVDSGRTIEKIIFYLKNLNPKSIEICTLLDKPGARKVEDINPRYVGFTIENKFVIGYGLDYNEKHRNLKDIAVMDSSDIKG
jgi:hypoxanthine phosphoribosyltransferase